MKDYDSDKRRKLIIFVASIIGFFIMVIIIILLYMSDARKTATLQTLIAPSFATITIDGKTYPVNQDIRLEPHHTTATISADGFKNQEIELDLITNEASEVVTFLMPNDGTLAWYEDRPKEFDLYQQVVQRQATIDGNDFLEEYPIANFIPYTYVDYNSATNVWTEYRLDIGKFEGCKRDICIKITDSTGGNHEHALNLIRKNGYNPDDYEIIYEYIPITPLE